MKKANILCHSFQWHFILESETHVLYRFIPHKVKYFKPLCLEIVIIMAYR